MLECRKIRLRAGEKHLFNLDELYLEKGLYALVGRNGTGKSTFLNALIGENTLAQGEIKINQSDLKDLPTGQLAQAISIVRSQSTVFGEHTAADVLMLGRIPYQGMLSKASNTDRHKVNEVINLLQIVSLKNRIFNTLSDGEKQLVMIGRALVQDTPIILLDEPTAFLDLVNRNQLMQILKSICEKTEKLIIFSTHHVDVIEQYCDGLLLISDGEMIFTEDQIQFIPQIETAFSIKLKL